MHMIPVFLRTIKTTFNKNASILSSEELLILFIFYTALRSYHAVLALPVILLSLKVNTIWQFLISILSRRDGNKRTKIRK